MVKYNPHKNHLVIDFRIKKLDVQSVEIDAHGQIDRNVEENLKLHFNYDHVYVPSFHIKNGYR